MLLNVEEWRNGLLQANSDQAPTRVFIANFIVAVAVLEKIRGMFQMIFALS